jgi:D-glycero-D-manno-heptose 1,7-bisphosphate phosphatase
MNKAVFLDRDGVINKSNLYYTFKKEDFIFNDGLIDSLKVIQQKGYMLFVITNQSGVAKGLYTNDDVESTHNYMTEQLQKNNIKISEVYHCPHHPDYSNCICRKPDSLLLEKIISRFDISSEQSYFIGDRQRDIDAAQKVNIKGILVEENSSILNILDTLV